MAKGEIIFDADGQRFYETGVEKCALFKHTGVAAAPYGSSSSTDNVGVAWNGITSISESPEGADVTDLYADNRKYLSLQAAENYKTTIEAYTYPDEFMECDGTAQLCTGAYFGQQTRKMFAIAYITKEGNDIEGNAYGEKLHIVYNCKAAPSQRQYQTINDSPEAMTFSWDVSTTPIGFKVGGKEHTTATIVVDKKDLEVAGSSGAAPTYPKWDALIKAIYGSNGASETANTPSYLPLPDEIYSILTAQ